MTKREFTPEQKAALNRFWDARENGENASLNPGDYPFFNFNVSVQAANAEDKKVAMCEFVSLLGLGSRELSTAMPTIEHPDQIQLAHYIDTLEALICDRVWVVPTTVHVSENGLFYACEIQEYAVAFMPPLDGDSAKSLSDAITARNEQWDIKPGEKLHTILATPYPATTSAFAVFGQQKQQTQPKAIMPGALAHPAFIEARRVCESLSDGRDGRNWAPIEGVIALLHSAPKSTHQIRFDPSARLLNWWGTSGILLDTLRAELARLDLDDIILFRVVLSAILQDEKARFSASLDDIITLIGRDTDARRSGKEREKWRAKVWRSIVLFESLAVIGKRGGIWREPAAKGEKRVKIDPQRLYTRDPLLVITGTRDTEQGTFDGSAPPKTVSIVPGDWLMEFHGNREILSEFGDVLPIAQMPRGKPSGAWAACAGLMLSQLWREQATKATVSRVSRGGENKVEVLKFRPFTRRELLAGTMRSDYDVNAILEDPKGRKERIKTYWTGAVKELKARGVISHYAELEGKSKPGSDWRKDWLDQPLDIRPAGDMAMDALEIYKAAQLAKKRSKRTRAIAT